MFMCLLIVTSSFNSLIYTCFSNILGLTVRLYNPTFLLIFFGLENKTLTGSENSNGYFKMGSYVEEIFRIS